MSSTTSRVRRWWTEEEDQVLRQEAAFQMSQGSLNDWSRIAAKLPGRTNKDCRKRWSKIPGHIKKGVWSNAEDQKLKSAVKKFGYRWTHVAQSVETRNADQCAKRWNHSLDPTLNHSEWVSEDDNRLFTAMASYGRIWKTIGEKEFPRRSATELKNRFVTINRKRQQSDLSTPQTAFNDSTAPASSPLEVDMESSEFTDSLSDDNEAGNQDVDFGSDIPSRSAPSHTTSGSSFPSHTALSLTTPGCYFSSQNVSPSAPSEIFRFTENEFPANLPNPPDGNDLFSSTPGTFFNQNDNPLQLDNQTLDLGPRWDMTPLPSPARKNDDAMTGVEVEQEKHGSTLILEDVQPQMVTNIIKMLFESKSAVNMKIVRQE